MTDFNALRNALNKSRTDHEAGQTNLSAVKARLVLLKQEEARLKRASNPKNTRNLERLAELKNRIGALEGQAEEAQSKLTNLTGEFQKINENWFEIGALTDPRVQLN